MAQAASYFGVEVPIGKRDRKSGSTKRKQTEIEKLNSSHGGAKLVNSVAN